MSKKTTNKPSAEKSNLPFKFNGVTGPNYTQVPDEILDFVMPFLTGAELKVLLYIIRRTFGFKKDTDQISIRQMVDGITTREGKVLDLGTGLSKASVVTALKGLTLKNIVLVAKLRTDERGDETNTYSLNCKEETQTLGKNFTPVNVKNTRVQKLDTPPVQKLDTPRVQKTDRPRVQKLDPQETALQKKEQQETEATTTIGTSHVEGNNEKDVVVALLIDFGISKKIAEKSASEKQPQYIQEKLAYAKFLIESAPEKIKNPNGWLRKAIEEDYGAPDGFSSEADREAAEKQFTIEQQQEEELARLEAARQQKQAQLEEANYHAWRNKLSEAYGTTEEDFAIWERALVSLKNAFAGSKTVYNRFVVSAEILSRQDDKVLLGVDSQFAVETLNHRNHVLFEREFKFIFQKPMQVEFVVVGSPEPVPEAIEVEHETGTGVCQVACGATRSFELG